MAVWNGNNTTGSTNNTSSDASLQLTALSYVSLVSFIIVFVVGIIGNAVVCYVFGYKRKRDRTLTETLFLYLGVVDLMASFINPLLHIYFTLTSHRKWPFGEVACKIIVPLAPITTTASAGIILMIGLDRYRVIVTPFKRHYSRKQIHYGVLLTTVLSVASFLHYIVAVKPLEGYTCQALVGDKPFSIPNIVMLIIRDTAFLTIFGWVNFRIFYALKQRQANQTLQLMTAGDASKPSNEMRVLITVGVVFLVLILPADLLHVIFTVSWLDNDGIAYTTILPANTFVKILQISNSCVNIFIYSRLHRKFRTIVKAQINSIRRPGKDGKLHDSSHSTELTPGPIEHYPILYRDYNNVNYRDSELMQFLSNTSTPETDV